MANRNPYDDLDFQDDDFGPRDYRFNEERRRWERTRQWRRDPNWHPGPYPEYGNDRFRNRYYNRGRAAAGWWEDPDRERGEESFRGWSPDQHLEDWEYGIGQVGDERYSNRDYGYPAGFRRNYDRYQRGYGRDLESNRYQRDWQSRARSSQNWRGAWAYPSAGMGADFYNEADYDYRDEQDEDLNFAGGDIGYESEGAFYQDLDEPINLDNQDYYISGAGYGSRSFRGMGPEGYRRSDERITEDVCDRLTQHGRVDARDITVDVREGEVTLQGSVPSREMKRIAEDVAERVPGVSDVHNQIHVERYNWLERERGATSRERSDETRAEIPTTGSAAYSPAGQTNLGAGLTSAGSLERMEPTTEERRDLREGMEVIGSDGKVVGQVKAIRQDDFLIDRELTRDIYAPFSAIASVGEQVMLNINADEVDQQDWEKPALF